MPVPEDDENKDQNPNVQNQDPSKFPPGTNPSNSSGMGNNYLPGGPSAPAARKLALDLTGVAGFAILDDDSEDSTPSSPEPSREVATRPAVTRPPCGSKATRRGNCWCANLDRVSLERLAAGGSTPGQLGSPLSGISQEDPGATPTPSTTGSAPPAAPTTSGAGAADANVASKPAC
jgi:hypothetical protein